MKKMVGTSLMRTVYPRYLRVQGPLVCARHQPVKSKKGESVAKLTIASVILVISAVAQLAVLRVAGSPQALLAQPHGEICAARHLQEGGGAHPLNENTIRCTARCADSFHSTCRS